MYRMCSHMVFVTQDDNHRRQLNPKIKFYVSWFLSHSMYRMCSHMVFVHCLLCEDNHRRQLNPKINPKLNPKLHLIQDAKKITVEDLLNPKPNPKLNRKLNLTQDAKKITVEDLRAQEAKVKPIP